ncbi:MAG: hypothetical protein KatS3mg042_0088 [Rhodothermaceae bacterium]|nr:MAG: hypothetical protein KatS3mg042_0088 [Rhodothermaceae bacterium]
MMGAVVAPVLHHIGHALHEASVRAAIARQVDHVHTDDEVFTVALPEALYGHPTCVFCTHPVPALLVPGPAPFLLPAAAPRLLIASARPTVRPGAAPSIRAPPFSA